MTIPQDRAANGDGQNPDDLMAAILREVAAVLGMREPSPAPADPAAAEEAAGMWVTVMETFPADLLDRLTGPARTFVEQVRNTERAKGLRIIQAACEIATKVMGSGNVEGMSPEDGLAMIAGFPADRLGELSDRAQATIAELRQ